MDLDIQNFILPLLSANVAGLFMGFERQAKSKPAGLKTNSLVSIGACVYIMISHQFVDMDSTDMTRIIGQLVVGVGFLGAGVIFQKKKKNRVNGLATAATLWCSAAAGCLAGFGYYLELIIFCALVVLNNLIFGYLNQYVSKMFQNKNN